MIYKTRGSIRFNREITEKDFITLGTIEVVTKSGNVCMDFMDYAASIDEHDRHILHFTEVSLDKIAFPESKKLRAIDIEGVAKLTVYNECETGAEPVRIAGICFEGFWYACYLTEEMCEDVVFA